MENISWNNCPMCYCPMCYMSYFIKLDLARICKAVLTLKYVFTKFITWLRGCDYASFYLLFKFLVSCEQIQNLKTPFFSGPMCYERINYHKLKMN